MIFYATVPSMEEAVGLSLKVLSIIPDNSEQVMFYLVREKRVWFVEVELSFTCLEYHLIVSTIRPSSPADRLMMNAFFVTMKEV